MSQSEFNSQDAQVIAMVNGERTEPKEQRRIERIAIRTAIRCGAACVILLACALGQIAPFWAVSISTCLFVKAAVRFDRWARRWRHV